MRWEVKQGKPEVFKKWFAWHPVRINNQWVWLEYVERLKWWDYNAPPSLNGQSYEKEYRLLNENIQKD